MPIAQPTSIGNVSAWSHSTIFTTYLTTYQAGNVPALTTFWNPPDGCSNRWMAESVVAIPMETITLALSMVTTDITTPAALRRGTMNPTFVPLITTPGAGRAPPSSGTFVAFSTNPSNTSSGALYDASYSSCQPDGAPFHYSPGICPNGQTVAEITEYHYSTTSGSIATNFEASCCQSDMAFRAEWESACVSNISSPLPIFEPFTTTIDGEGITTYEYVGQIFVASTYGTNGYSTRTFNNISIVTSGFVGADPVVVGFQEHDLLSFPADYVSSLAKRYNRTWAAATTTTPPSNTATTGSSPSLPAQLSPPPPSSKEPSLSTGARAGIGVGVSISSIAIAIIGTLLFFRGRRKSRMARLEVSEGIPEMEDRGIPEMEDRDEVLSNKKWYLFGRWRNEMPAENKRQELESPAVRVLNRVPVELDTSERPQELEPHDADGTEQRGNQQVE